MSVIAATPSSTAPDGLAPASDLREAVAYIKQLDKPTVADVLQACEGAGKVAVQPRCGVGGQGAMHDLLTQIERESAPEIATLTIDSYTRLENFAQADALLASAPEQLNGYPLVSHGVERARALNEAIRAPLDIRHGSPVANRLFETAIAAGITSFEGGGVTYNLPYCKDVPLARSLESWARIDRQCGELAEDGVIVAREMFGTLTAVLMPPSLSLAISFLEAISAARAGVRCLLIAYPQGGNLVQDVAALLAVRDLAARYLPASVDCYPVLHQYMGPFPEGYHQSCAVIAYGALVAKAGRARKVVVKTAEESHGIPSGRSNAEVINMVRALIDSPCDPSGLGSEKVEAERAHIVAETRELIEGVLTGGCIYADLCAAFADGRLDVPFAPSRHVHGAVLPVREANGAIRYLNTGRLPFSAATQSANAARLSASAGAYEVVASSINYFAA
jgi:methylaspartate mutase epsilon subunit